MKNVIILHFQPVELYPPVQNFLNFLQADLKNINILVLTTNSINNNIPPFNLASSLTYIKRIGRSGKDLRSFLRYFNYFLYNFICILELFRKKPEKVLYYETLSSFPAWFYKKFINKNAEILVHYHEFTSCNEYKNGMKLNNFFHRLERSFYPAIKWLSHTNDFRMNMFLKEHMEVDREKAHVLQNYPPSSWGYTNKKTNSNYPVKAIHVGALSTEYMYLKEFVLWILQQNGKITLDIFSNNLSKEVISFIDSFNTNLIKINEPVKYEELPSVLRRYNIGVILYKGLILNHIFSEPNKLFEYYNSGLDVWFPTEIKGSLQYVTSGTFPKIISLDFNNTNKWELDELINRSGLFFNSSVYTAETVLPSLANAFLN